MTGAAFPCSCGKGLRSLEALRQHQKAIGCTNAKQHKNKKSSNRMKKRHRDAAQRRMSGSDAIDLADAMDLPDGAYFAMVGELMGGDYMDGVEAVIAEIE